jgi:hypothetical protein
VENPAGGGDMQPLQHINLHDVTVQQVSKNAHTKIYKIILLPLVLYRCEAWHLILRQELRLTIDDDNVCTEVGGNNRRPEMTA